MSVDHGHLDVAVAEPLADLVDRHARDYELAGEGVA